MSYRVIIERAAERDMGKLPGSAKRRVISKIESLANNPYQRGTKKLATGMGFRVSVGHYRVLYRIDDDTRTVLVRAVRHRREAYR